MLLLGLTPATAATTDGMALIFIVTGVVTLYLWIASFYEFVAFNLALLFLWIAFGLRGIAMFTGVDVLTIIAGIGAIISGLIAAYASFAAIYNAASLYEDMPLGESAAVRDRAEQDEMERIRRIHPTNHVTEKAGIHA